MSAVAASLKPAAARLSAKQQAKTDATRRTKLHALGETALPHWTTITNESNTVCTSFHGKHQLALSPRH